MISLGIRNNNPGNLELNAGIHWLGQVGATGAYLQFDTPLHGIRALALDLLNQQRMHGLSCVKTIITKFAPASENDTRAYIADVADHLCVDELEGIVLTDAATLHMMVEAVIHHENGSQPYDDQLVAQAVALALAS